MGYSWVEYDEVDDNGRFRSRIAYVENKTGEVMALVSPPIYGEAHVMVNGYAIGEDRWFTTIDFAKNFVVSEVGS